MRVIAFLAIVVALVVFRQFDGMSEAEQFGKTWCDQQATDFEASRKEGEVNDLSLELPEKDKPRALSSASFSGRKAGGYECSLVITGGLFPRRHAFDSATGTWEILD